MRSRILLKLTLSSALLLLTACSTLIPTNQYQRQIESDIAHVENWRSLTNSGDVSYLNELFNSTDVDNLLKQAFSDNPNFQQIMLTLDIRREQLKQTAADQRPQINAGLLNTRNENTDNTYNGSLSVSWQADLWGKLKDSSHAADIDIAEQEMLVQSARNSLGADILRQWLELISQKQAIVIQQHRILTLEQNESFVLQRYRNGLGTLSDFDSAHLSSATAHATLAANQQQFDQNLRNLQSLIGQLSGIKIVIPDVYPDVSIPSTDFPDQVLGQRPDLQAAYLAIQASELRTAVAYKELLPSFNLQAALENVATTARDALFVSPVWALLGQLTAPLYQGGKLRAEAEIAELNSAIAYQVYKQKLLTAVIEIENYTAQEQSLQQQLHHLEAASQSANNNLINFQQSYRTGLVSMLDLLTVQRQTYDLDSQINETIFALLSNRISLGLALALEIKQ
tara:strand:- start:51762 stop:53123 length:1362 start_codon:yes stop_codon:yes gene_type:complete